MYWVRVPLLLLWSVLLSAFTVILGATPLRVLRLIVGSNYYWLLSVVGFYGLYALGWYPIAAIFGLQVLLVGTFSEFEERGSPLRQAAGFAVSLTALFSLSCFYIWTAFVGKGWLNQILNVITGVITQITAIRADLVGSLKAQDILTQIPSIAVILMILSIALALVLEKSLSRWAGIKVLRREKLSDFYAQDFLVWVFILSLLGTFSSSGVRQIELISINALNICVAVYFLQGTAILGKYFTVFKLNLFWRITWIFVMVLQLPLLLSVVGLVDYWADFRRGFIKKAAQLKNKKVQE